MIKVCSYSYIVLQLLDKFENVVIPRDYPEVSSSIDRTTQESLTFVDTCATLKIHPVQGWSVEQDKELVQINEIGHNLQSFFR